MKTGDKAFVRIGGVVYIGTVKSVHVAVWRSVGMDRMAEG